MEYAKNPIRLPSWYCVKDVPFPLNPLNPELNPICYLLVLLAHHFLHVSRIRGKSLTLRLLMSYIYIYIYIYIYDISNLRVKSVLLLLLHCFS